MTIEDVKPLEISIRYFLLIRRVSCTAFLSAKYLKIDGKYIVAIRDNVFSTDQEIFRTILTILSAACPISLTFCFMSRKDWITTDFNGNYMLRYGPAMGKTK